MADKTFSFKNEVTYTGEKKGILTVKEKHNLEVATLPDFGGPKDSLNPEDLFVGSVNSCTMTTFLYFAEKLQLTFLNFTCKAEGVVTRTAEGQFVFSRVSVHPVIDVKNEKEREIATKTLELTERHCWIGRSIDKQIVVKFQPTIRVTAR